MKAIEINGEIKLFNVLPKNWSDENGSHFNIGDGNQLGFKNVVNPDFNERIEELTNLHLEGDIYTYDVIEKPIKETLSSLKKMKVLELKNLVANKLSLTDWYIVREADSGEPTPQSIKDERAALRTQSNNLEAQINALSTKKEVVLFDINI